MKHQKHLFGGAAALLVLAVFAVGILGTLLGGAGIYRRLTLRDQQSFNSRTCTQYITTRVRQAAGQVQIARFGTGDALLIREMIDGEPYLTRVYCFDGWLMELFSAETGSFDPQDGEKLLPAQDLSLEMENGLLSVRITDGSGTGHTLYLHLHRQEGMP